MFRVYVLTLDVTCRQMFRLWVLNLKPKHWLPGRRPRVVVVVRRWRQCDVCQGSILRASDSRMSSASCSWNTLMIQPCFCMAKGYHRSLPTLLIPMKISWSMKNFWFAFTRECPVCPDTREQKNDWLCKVIELTVKEISNKNCECPVLDAWFWFQADGCKIM